MVLRQTEKKSEVRYVRLGRELAFTALYSASDSRSTVEKSALHSSCERGCQEKSSFPSPRGKPALVTYIQPCLLIRGAFDVAAFVRRVVQRRCQSQWIIPT